MQKNENLGDVKIFSDWPGNRKLDYLHVIMENIYLYLQKSILQPIFFAVGSGRSLKTEERKWKVKRNL